MKPDWASGFPFEAVKAEEGGDPDLKGGDVFTISGVYVVNPGGAKTRSKAEYEQHIGRLLEYCLFVTNHEEYLLRMTFMDEPADHEREGSDTCAAVSISSDYLQMSIQFYPGLMGRWLSGKLETVAEIVLHEMCHAFIQPVQEIFEDTMRPCERVANTRIVERQVVRIQNAISQLLPKNWYTPEFLAIWSKQGGKKLVPDC